jgi:hypothetical protein
VISNPIPNADFKLQTNLKSKVENLAPRASNFAPQPCVCAGCSGCPERFRGATGFLADAF